MIRLRLHIFFFLAIAWLAFSCVENETKEQKNEPAINNISKTENIPEKKFQYENQTKQVAKSKKSAKESEIIFPEKQENISRDIAVEFSELVSREISIKNKADKSLHQKEKFVISGQKTVWALRVIFDNDIFNNTDYYYTNGARIELVTPFANPLPVEKILPGAGKGSISFSGFSLTQNIYTPINPDSREIQYNDRPFSAFLTFGQFRESVNFSKKVIIKSELDLGIVGPASLGGKVQSSIHDIEPVGWENQVKNDFVINYNFQIEKSMVSNPHFELNALATASAGTLFDNTGAGFFLRAGHFLPVYRGPLSLISNQKSKQPAQYWFFIRGNSDFVFYDATLQGGMFNNYNPYVIKPADVNRVIFGAGAGIAYYYNWMGIELENFYLSPEFKGAKHFMYGRIKLTATF